MARADDLRWQLIAPLPALWRGQGVLQVGLEPPAGIILHDVPEPIADLVTALSQPRHRGDLLRLAPGLDVSWIDWLLDQLSTAGLLRHPEPGDRTITVVGAGRLGQTLTDRLLQDGLHRIRLVALGANAPGQRRLTRLRAKYTSARLDIAPHWSSDTSWLGQLVVVAVETDEADRVLTDQLFRDDKPHLVARAGSPGGVVGPLVVPGRTPCIRCEDLHRAANDPAWPHLLAQLCARRPMTDALALQWTAMTAMIHTRAFLSGGLPDSLGATVELGTADLMVRTRMLRSHPSCGCLSVAA